MQTAKPARTETSPEGDRPQGLAITPLVIATGVFNILVPLFLLLFVWEHAAAFLHTWRLSNLVILTKVALDMQFCVRRSTAPFVCTSAYAWLIAFCGTITPLLFRPTLDPSDFQLATVIQVIGVALQVYLITGLHRTSDVSIPKPAVNREGLYHFVRHPFHLAFIIIAYGYVLNHTTLYNLCILVIVTFFQVLRINEEERLLCGDAEYREYAQQTPWRIIPRVY